MDEDGNVNVTGEQVADRYLLEAPLGHGGMGEVWRAYDPQLGRRVAIKFLPAHLAADPRRVRRFQREAQVTAQLQHPGITQVFDIGVQHGRPHLVLELLDGEDLAAVLRRQPSGIPVRQAVRLAAQAADALAHAHARDIVHRDIKPANLVLLRDGRLKVCDFGIAGFVLAESTLTRDGGVVGTPDYMAPEQCLGDPVDGRADLYALGCVLFALLTGRPPFTARNGHGAVMLDHIRTPPPRPTSRRPELPDDIDELVLRLLAKDPAERPTSAPRVAARLRAVDVGAEAHSDSYSTPDSNSHSHSHSHSDSDSDVDSYVDVSASRTDTQPGHFALELFHNQYLEPGATELHAVVSLHAPDEAPQDATGTAPRALVFVLGLSTTLPDAQFRAAKASVAAAIDGLDEGGGLSFAVVAGSEYATMLYPDTLRLVPANPTTKAEARAAVQDLEPAGAAAFGRWVRLADRLFTGHADAVRAAILLLDRPNDAEPPDETAAALAACAGRFTGHVRGIGTDWVVAQGRGIAKALSGTIDLDADPAGANSALPGDLASLIARTRQSSARDLALRLTTPPGCEVRFLKQVVPTVEDVSDLAYPVGPGVADYPVTIPDGGSHEYHISFRVPPGRSGERTDAAVLNLVLLPPTGHGQSLARLSIPVEWTDETTGLMPVHVARYVSPELVGRLITQALYETRSDDDPPTINLRPLKPPGPRGAP